MNKIITIKTKKYIAFTLIETILYTAVFSIFMTAMTVFVNSVISAKAKNEIILDVERQGEYIGSIIYDSLINSSNIISPVDNTSFSLSFNTYTNNDNPSLIYLNNNTIYLKKGNNDAIALSSGNISVTNLYFSENSFNNSPENITASFKLSSITENSSAEFNYFRNFEINASRRY